MLKLLSLLQATPDGLLFRSEKIFAVLTVILLIWVGIIVYLLLTNRKISRLERRFSQPKK
ncbi:MAG: CcmD family protein [Bacteroidetes bacterium]|jgi:CcmD family protein|nr:CcmD family protein [Bacteroidota bacterium]